jgi:putative sigma-54 modulation protein
MDLQLKAHQVSVTQQLQAYIDRKIGRLDRYLDRVTDATLELRVQHPRTGGVRHIAQLTIATNFALLRAEEEATDIHAAVDAVTTKMERQIVRYRSKWKSRRHARHEPEPELPMPDVDEDPADVPASEIVRTKAFSSKPIDTDEAIEQMELLGHTFYAFINVESGVVNVVYRRRNGGYGLLRPQT